MDAQLSHGLIFLFFGLTVLMVGIGIGVLIGTSLGDNKSSSCEYPEQIYTPTIPKTFIEVDYYHKR